MAGRDGFLAPRMYAVLLRSLFAHKYLSKFFILLYLAVTPGFLLSTMPYNSGAVVEFMDFTSVGAVIEDLIRFDSVIDYFIAVVSTCRGKGVNPTLKTVKSV